MDSKSIFKTFFFVATGLVLLLLVVVPHLLAPLTQWGLDTFLAARPGAGTLKVIVRHMGLSGAVMGPIRIGNNPLIDSVTVNYPLSDLVQGRPGAVHITGLDIRGVLTDQGITFPDADLLFPRNPNTPSPSRQETADSKAVSVQDILRHFPPLLNITHSHFAMSLKGRSIDIPFGLSVDTAPGKNDISLGFQLSPLGQLVHGGLVFNPMGDVKHFELTAREIDFSRFNNLLHAWFSGVSLGQNGDITINSNGSGSFEVRLSHLSLDEPVPISLDNLVLNLTMAHGVSIPFRETLFPMHARFSFQLNRDPMPPLLLSGEFMVNGEGNWQLNVMDGHKDESEWFFRYKNMEILVGQGLGFHVMVKGQALTGQIQAQMAAGDLSFQNIPLPVSLSRILVNGTGRFDFSSGGNGLTMDMTTTLERMQGAGHDVQLVFPGVDLGLSLLVNPRGQPSLSGTIKTENGSFSRLGTTSFKMSGIHLNLPFAWPLGTKVPPGAFSGKEISFNGHSLASMGGEIGQNTQGMGISGMLTFPFFVPAPPSGESEGSAAVNFPHALFNLEFPFSSTSSSAMNLTWEMPAFPITHAMVYKTGLMAQDAVFPSFNAILAARGNMVLGAKNRQNRLQVDLTKGSLAAADNTFEINGINASLVFDDLPRIRSAPGMVLTMDSLRFNKMAATDIHLRYTVESPTNLLLEKLSFNWCGGEVTTGATRFSTGIDAYHMRMFCHRLRFADLLQQLGSFKAVGEGSLNGQIPVSWVNGDISFDNGFLYSTPGVGGTIQVSNTEILTAGIPVNTLQFGQMDLAREALKNYTYKWARVGFNSQGEDLMVKLEFDGTPENILPFEYRRDMGGFVRVDAAGSGSRFQGIKLDVNLNLPFNRVMKLGNRLNNLLH